MKKLTPKQEAFANKYVECGNASEAYRFAYDAKATSKEVVWKEASLLLVHRNVAVRVLELQEDLQTTRKVTREDIRALHYEIIDWYKELKQLARRTDLTKDDKARVYMLKDLIKGSDFRGSVDSITKMYGLNEPDKAEVKVERVEVTIKRSKK